MASRVYTHDLLSVSSSVRSGVVMEVASLEIITHIGTLVSRVRLVEGDVGRDEFHRMRRAKNLSSLDDMLVDTLME